MLPQPHDLLLVYKNLATDRNSTSHVGLGVTAQNAARLLRLVGHRVETLPVFDGYELREQLRSGAYTPTHVVLFAPWLDTPFLQSLLRLFPHIAFAVSYHSNVGFLQADRWAVKILREETDLELINHNFSLAANSCRLVDAIQAAFKRPAVLLPNLYGFMPATRHVYHQGDVLRLGVFGAMRPQKNMLTAVWAGVRIANLLQVRAEISINSGRIEGGAGVLGAIRELCAGLTNITLHEAGWMSWSQFRAFVGLQHLLLSPSYTESFCNVTCDGIAEGVPSVVSSAMDWAPAAWKADVDDTASVAAVGLRLLRDRNALKAGGAALDQHNALALRAWGNWLDGSRLAA